VIWMKKLTVLCLSLALLTGCKKKAGDTSTGAKAQPPVASTAPSSPTTPSVASGATTLPTKASEQQPRGQSSAPPKEPTLAQVLAAAGLKPPVEVDPCEPEMVDSSLEGEIAFNHREHALAFVIDYDSYDRFRGSSGLVQKPVNPGKVVYVYRYVNDEAKLDYREMLVSDVEKRFGKLSLRALLEPTVLEEIFRGTVGS
jgi:hypothetical protein